jgi:hypothetical protein
VYNIELLKKIQNKSCSNIKEYIEYIKSNEFNYNQKNYKYTGVQYISDIEKELNIMKKNKNKINPYQENINFICPVYVNMRLHKNGNKYNSLNKIKKIIKKPLTYYPDHVLHAFASKDNIFLCDSNTKDYAKKNSGFINVMPPGINFNLRYDCFTNSYLMAKYLSYFDVYCEKKVIKNDNNEILKINDCITTLKDKNDEDILVLDWAKIHKHCPQFMAFFFSINEYEELGKFSKIFNTEFDTIENIEFEKPTNFVKQTKPLKTYTLGNLDEIEKTEGILNKQDNILLHKYIKYPLIHNDKYENNKVTTKKRKMLAEYLKKRTNQDKEIGCI